MYIEPSPPKKLQRIQRWFGETISRPLLKGEKINLSTSHGGLIDQVNVYLIPSPSLKAIERIQIYNQLYWRRLLQVMQVEFPTTLRLFHYRDFNRLLAIPYLKKYPPMTWSLNDLGSFFLQWIKEEYRGDDKALVLAASEIDTAFNKSFIAKQYPSLKIEQNLDLSNWMSRPLRLQPHVLLLTSSFDVLTLRASLLDYSPDEWLDKEFPAVNNKNMHYICIYRNKRLNVVGDYLSETAYHFLSLFQQTCTLDKACEWLQGQSKDVIDYASKHLSKWLKTWIQRGFFFLP